MPTVTDEEDFSFNISFNGERPKVMSTTGVNKKRLLREAISREKKLRGGDVRSHMKHEIAAATARIYGARVCDNVSMLAKSLRRKKSMLKQRAKKRRERRTTAQNELTEKINDKATASRQKIRSTAKRRAEGKFTRGSGGGDSKDKKSTRAGGASSEGSGASGRGRGGGGGGRGGRGGGRS
eukprot:PhM_4_TR5504/c0_g1_i1/m.44330